LEPEAVPAARPTAPLSKPAAPPLGDDDGTVLAPPAAALVAPTTAPPSGRPPLAALLLVVAVGLAFADASVVALALPDLYGELDTTIVGVSWVLTTYALVVALTAIPVALLHRRIRPAVLAGTGLGLFAVASLAAGLASSLPFLLTARAVQGVGATLLLAGSIPVLGAGLGSLARARRWWGAAAAAGAVAGPALGGVLTQLLAWRAIFLVQAPVAAVAFLACLTPAARALVADRQIGARRRRAGLVAALPANLAFVLVFAGLVAALFLGVLLAIEVWSYPPITAAVLVSALPVGMFAARWAGPARGVLGAVGGPLLLAAGLCGLAFLPGASPWAAAIAFALCGAGFGVVSALLDPATTPDHGELVRDSTVSIGARHAGLVLGLVLIAPVLTASLDKGIDRATLGATRSMLEAEVPVTDKVAVAWDLRDIMATTPKGQVPDLGQVFDEHGAKGNNKMAVARDGLMTTITDTITRSFRPAFAVAALLAALAAVPAWVVARQRRRREPRAGPRHRLVGVVAVGALAAAGLFVAEQAAGASNVGTYVAADPCTAGPDPYPGSGLDAVAQRIALSALNGAACDLHTTRERLVLSLDPKSGYTDVTWDDATREQALRAGTQRAIDDAEDRGTLPGWAAAVLRFTADHAPVTWIVEHLPF
jgi:MFS family permease